MRSNKIISQINANVVAESLMKEFGLKRSDALNLFATWSGFQDFGALKSKLQQSRTTAQEVGSDSSVNPEVEAKYAILTFRTRTGAYENNISNCFTRSFEGDTRTKQEFLYDIYCYALFFYDDIGSYINEHFSEKVKALRIEGKEQEEIERILKPMAVQRALKEIEDGNGHFNCFGEVSIERIDVRFISKADFEIDQKAQRIRRGF